MEASLTQYSSYLRQPGPHPYCQNRPYHRPPQSMSSASQEP